MRKERILTPSVLTGVLLVHIGLGVLLWRVADPEIHPLDDIQFVDLGELGGGDGQTEGAAALPPPPPQPKVQPKPKPQPKVQPKPKPQPKPEVKTVKVKEDKADIHLKPKTEKPKPEPKPKAEPKPDPKPEPKPEPQPKAVEPKPMVKPVEKTVEASKGGGSANSGSTDKNGSGKGSQGEGKGKGLAQGGSGSGSSTGQGNGKGEGGGGGNGAGSSASNPVKRSGSIPQPPYPPISLENGEEGRVVLRISVAPNGKATSVSVVKSSGFSRLDNAAKRAARQGSFQTGGLYTEYTVPVNFKIQ